MKNTQYVRLRQVCLATLQLQKEEQALARILGLAPCHRSILDQFGLENSLFAVNGTFIELVAPTRENTAVHRFLTRSKGQGGYMAIFDCDDVDARKKAAANLGIDPVFERSNSGADLLQLNPKQTGVTLLEFDHHQNGDHMLGHYEWAGQNWQNGLNKTVTEDMLSVTFCCQDPVSRARQWSLLFGKATDNDGADRTRLPLDYGHIDFTQAEDLTADHFSALHLTAAEPEALLARASAEGYPVTTTSFFYCGVHINIGTPQ